MSPEPLLDLNDAPEPAKTLKPDKYLNFIEECHSRINSKLLDGVDGTNSDENEVKDESSSEICSEHRLQSSSSDNNSTLRLEETQGKLYVIKKIDEINTVKIPQLDLNNIIEKQNK